MAEESARNRAALFSRDRVSALAVALTPVFCSAERNASGWYSVLRLFHTVLRFCPNDCFKKLMKSCSGTLRLSSLCEMVSRTTLDSTLGGGEKALAGRVNSFSGLA